jgi:hypothetical protein
VSNKSGVSSQAISLPKGGGAVKGIGETFQPNLFSGTGNHSIPIALSPGRNGFGPALSLQYSSGNGNGPFGLGWGLSIPGVSRKTSRGIPRYEQLLQDSKHPIIKRTIQPDERRNEVTEMQRALITLGANIAHGELATEKGAGTYGPRTQTAIIALLDRFGAEHPNPPIPFNASVGRLLNIAVGAELGNSAALQEAVRESFAVIQTAPVAVPDELAWLARYAVMALDFTTARKIATQIPNEPVIREKVNPIVNLNTLQPPAPELLNPENYLTNRYDYVSRSRINALIGRT